MRHKLCLAATATLLFAGIGWCAPQQQSQQADQPSGQPATSRQAKPDQAQASTNTPDPLVEAARRAREKNKTAPKATKVFTNDNLPSHGDLSTVGQPSDKGSADEDSNGDAAKTAAPATSAASSSAEQGWRKRFAGLREKLQHDQDDLDVMQRELGVLNLQQYSDPVKAMQQQLSRDDINKKTADIEAKKKDIAADQQAITDAEEELRKSGGDPGWER